MSSCQVGRLTTVYSAPLLHFLLRTDGRTNVRIKQTNFLRERANFPVQASNYFFCIPEATVRPKQKKKTLSARQLTRRPWEINQKDCCRQRSRAVRLRLVRQLSSAVGRRGKTFLPKSPVQVGLHRK